MVDYGVENRIQLKPVLAGLRNVAFLYHLLWTDSIKTSLQFPKNIYLVYCGQWPALSSIFHEQAQSSPACNIFNFDVMDFRKGFYFSLFPCFRGSHLFPILFNKMCMCNVLCVCFCVDFLTNVCHRYCYWQGL
jgi:hypothetical protein